MTQSELIAQALTVTYKAKVLGDMTPGEYLMVLMYCHTKGWLYLSQHDGKVVSVIAAYRIPEVTEAYMGKLPPQEGGTILYIPMAASLDPSENVFKSMRETLRKYLEQNPDITEIVIEKENNQLKRYKRKGVENEQEQGSGVTTDTDVSGGAAVPTGVHELIGSGEQAN